MLTGHIDYLTLMEIRGWAQDDARPEERVSLIITDNDNLVGRVLANRYRPDLHDRGFGSGFHSFEYVFPIGLSPSGRHVIRVCRESDGVDIPRSPAVLEPKRVFDDEVEVLLTRILATCGADEDIPRKIDFLANEIDHLMQQFSDSESNRSERARVRRLRSLWKRRSSQENTPTPNHGEAASQARALVIDNRIPKADRDAGSNTIISHMRSLQRLDYEVNFAPSLEFCASQLERAELEAIEIGCCCSPYYNSVEDILRRQAGEFDLVYLHRVDNAAKYTELVRHYFPRAQLLFSVADLHHLRLARQAAVEQRPELAPTIRRVRLLELVAAASADTVITHSSYEAQILHKHIGTEKVHVIPWSVSLRPTEVPFSERRGIAFIGGSSHRHNCDAARWLINEIMPLVKKQAQGIECFLVGSEIPDEIRRLCGNGVIAIGYVKNLSDIFDKVRLTVAPLAYGAGAKGNVIESLAAGVSCVCTPAAAEGLDLPEALKVGDTAVEIANAICLLHEDEALNENCCEAGLDYVWLRFSEFNVDRLMQKALRLSSKGTPAA
jgi:glycosyltransferase involved in cell wall biosynthesis